MNSGSLFRWFCNKLTFVNVIIVLVAAWWVSSIKYDGEINGLKSNLLSLSLEVNNGKSLDDISQQGINYSLLNKEGILVSDKQFGSISVAAESDYFKQTLNGQTIFKEPDSVWSKETECWGNVKYEGAPHVLILRQEIPYSRIVYFFIFIFIIGVFTVGVLLTFSSVITGPVKDALTYLTEDLRNLKKEKFEKKQPSLDTIEFIEVFDAYNSLSKHIQHELNGLRTEVSQWEVFFSTMPRGLIAIDKERIIHNCNTNAFKILEVEDKAVEETSGQSIMSVFRNADLNRITSQFFESGKFLQEYEFEMVVNNIVESLKVICVELEFPDTENSEGAIVIIENITSLRRLENMRKDFVSNVSHELKTPISIIAGFIETLKECLDDPQSSMRFIEIIEKNTARLTVIIDDLLSLSKLEQNEAVIRKDFEHRNISETVRSALDVCSHEAKRKNIKIELDLEDSKYYGKETMLANHRLLEQALRNLIENAIRYSPNESSITISSRKIKNEIEIAIKDSGMGIAKEHHDKIFGRFYRVDKSRDRQTGGSGLGLAIVKHIARIHDGRVRLQSEPGKGSTFTLVLPYNSMQSSIPSAAIH